MTWLGAVLAGKYRVDRVLGQGGMGVVVQATHLQLGKPVAMKFLLPGVLANTQAVQRFLREAQAAVRLKNEHVARVIDVGTLDAGEPYMVLEYLDGTDLSSFPRAHLSVGIIIDDGRSDIWSLGIVLYELSQGATPFQADTFSSMIVKVVTVAQHGVRRTMRRRVNNGSGHGSADCKLIK